jgi:hypothetical protein
MKSGSRARRGSPDPAVRAVRGSPTPHIDRPRSGLQRQVVCLVAFHWPLVNRRETALRSSGRRGRETRAERVSSDGGVRRPAPSACRRTAGSGDPRRARVVGRRGRETRAERASAGSETRAQQSVPAGKIDTTTSTV